jgi:serine protease Do
MHKLAKNPVNKVFPLASDKDSLESERTMAVHPQLRQSYPACPRSLPRLPSSPISVTGNGDRRRDRQSSKWSVGPLLSCTTMLIISAGYAVAQTGPENNQLAQLSGSIRQLTNRVAPSVIEIIVTGYGSGDAEHGGVSNQISMQRSSGSGVIVDPSGYIMTNAHVVLGAISVKVLMADREPPRVISSHLRDGMVVKEARIIGIDSDSDLALLRVDGNDLRALGFGDSDEVRQGDLVFAIGSPAGLRNSLSMGVVSASARAVNDENPILYIQTDASINPGNSGGALVDTKGSLIGLNAYILSQSGGNEGIGFAVPSNIVRNVYQQLREKGRVSRGTVGLFVQNITAPMAAGLDLPSGHGIVVADVNPGGPGDQAGVKRKDVVVSLNGEAIQIAREFENAIYRRRPGDALKLVIQRSSSQLEITLTMAEKSDPADPLASLVSPENNLVKRLGILCVEIDKKVAEALPDLRRQYGLIVAAKAPGNESQFIDLQENDVIHSINNQVVTDLELFRKTIDDLKPGSAVALQVERNHRLQYVAFDIQ